MTKLVLIIYIIIVFGDAKKISHEVWLLTQKTFPKKESSSGDANNPASPIRLNQSASISDAQRKHSSPARKESSTTIVEENKSNKQENETDGGKPKKEKIKDKGKNKNFSDSIREPLLSNKKKDKKEKKTKKKSKKSKKGEEKENKCCSCW